MDQKSHLHRAKSLFSSLVLGWSLVCAIPSSSYSEKTETAQIVNGMIIDQFGTFPVGSDAIVKVSEEKGTVILSITCKGGKMSTSQSYTLTNRPNSGWFVYAVSNREFWSFDGERKGRKWKFSADAANSDGTIFPIGEVLSSKLPQRFAERIMQSRAAGIEQPTGQATDGIFINQPGSYPFGKNATVDITIKDNQVHMAITHEFVTVEEVKSKTITSTSTRESSTTNQEIISRTFSAPWFVYLSKNRELWAYDGFDTIHSSKIEADGSTDVVSNSTVSRSESFRGNPPENTPKDVAERILKIQAAKPKAP